MANEETKEIKFTIKRLYVKDSSFESPQSPKIFNEINAAPKIDFNMNSNMEKISDNSYEVVIEIRVKAEVEKDTVYLAEIKQGGMFEIEGAGGEILQQFLNVKCLEIIFPYARENISTLIQKGGFPPLFLAPIDFNTLFLQELEKRKNKSK
ncbi:MAG: protein-export chaperone SecB [Pseudomonadota bacterium]|nr:protein-export chaperone SecB [Pseudomonadota bacterium]